MKTISLSLIALAALSSAALASERTDIDPRDRNDTGSPLVMVGGSYAVGDEAAFAVAYGDTSGSSNFERLTMQSIINEDSRNN